MFNFLNIENTCLRNFSKLLPVLKYRTFFLSSMSLDLNKIGYESDTDSSEENKEESHQDDVSGDAYEDESDDDESHSEKDDSHENVENDDDDEESGEDESPSEKKLVFVIIKKT